MEADTIIANVLQGRDKAPVKFHARQLTTRADAVHHEIERQIVSGEMSSGMRLNEATIAETLGVSRGPVREAIRSLAQSGLVELAANRGAVVRRMAPEEAMGLYELRGVVFALACEQVAASSNPSVVAELDLYQEAMIGAAKTGQSDVYYKLNIAFHDAIMNAYSNPEAQLIYAGLIKQLHLCRRRGLAIPENKMASLSEHAAIIEAIRNGDPAEAFRAGRLHVENGRIRFAGTLSGNTSDPAVKKN